FVSGIPDSRYDSATGILRRNVIGPTAVAVGEFKHSKPLPHWAGGSVLAEGPLTVQTSSAGWGFSLVLESPIPKVSLGGKLWARIDFEVISGGVGIGMFVPDLELVGEQFFQQGDGRIVLEIPLAVKVPRLMVRSGGHPSSKLRIYRADLLHDPDLD